MYAQGLTATWENYELFIKGEVKRNSHLLSFLYEKRIEERGLRQSTKISQIVALEALARFGKIDSFASLTSANIAAFDIFLRTEDPKRSQATIHNYHKRIKVYVNEVYALEYIDRNPL